MAEKIPIAWDAMLRETLHALSNGGALLVTRAREGRPNVMTIGWASIGMIWGRPVFTVMVRPSRYSWALLREHGDFTVNVMPSNLEELLAYCGAVSGRQEDKFITKKLTAVPGRECSAPILGEGLIAYECRTVLTAEVDPRRLDKSICATAYADGDCHTMFFGHILCVRAEEGIVSGKGEPARA